MKTKKLKGDSLTILKPNILKHPNDDVKDENDRLNMVFFFLPMAATPPTNLSPKSLSFIENKGLMSVNQKCLEISKRLNKDVRRKQKKHAQRSMDTASWDSLHLACVRS